MGVGRLVALYGVRPCARARSNPAPRSVDAASGGQLVNRRLWNALQVGDHVLVHDEDEPEQPIVPGRVSEVQSAPGSNDVEIRIRPTRGRARLVRPRRLAVHLDEIDPDGHCWRCDARPVGDDA